MNDLRGIKVLFGGSFNPPTKAHFEIARSIIEKFNVIDFVFLPTGNVYNKANLIDAKYRIEMLELLCKKLTNARVSDYEMKQTKYLGTYKTLEDFKGYYFVMGADNFITLHQWINYPKVVIENHFIIINRNGIDLEKYAKSYPDIYNNLNNFIIFNEFKEVDISSSLFNKTKDYSLLEKEVVLYIKKHNLY